MGAIDVRTWLDFLAVVTLSLVSAVAATAQVAPTASLPPAITLAYVDGRVDVARRDGVQPAQAPDVLEGGDRLITADGRAELVFADGSLVHVDRGSDLRFDDDVPLSVVRGRVVVRTAATAAALDVGTPAGIVRLEPRGEYLITARDLDGESTIAALSGRATLTLPTADVPIAADDEVAVDPRGLEPRWTRVGVQRDAFTDWAARRVDDMDHARGAQPLPVELTAYAPAFATYGRWDTLPTYGSVWFPTAAPGWRPYANGTWRYTRYGWTWIDSDPWGWPVHHYGRWGRHPSRGWYWMPRRTWGPAWVGWAVEADYIGWSPLGWNSRPVVDFFVGARVGPVDLRAGSWSVLPRRHFGGHGPIGRHYADVRHLPGPVLGGFVVQSQSPRGPAGWDRRLPAARGYGRPVPAGRHPRAYDRAPGYRGPSGPEAVPRSGPRPRGPAATPLPTPRDDGGGRVSGGAADARAWRTPGGGDARVREVAPRPGDARPVDPGVRDQGPDRGRVREVAPRDGRGDDGGSYGRPTAAPGRAWGRPEAPAEAGAARPRAQGADQGRGGQRSAGSTAEPATGRGAERQRSGGGAPSGGGNRRRPR